MYPSIYRTLEKYDDVGNSLGGNLFMAFNGGNAEAKKAKTLKSSDIK